MYKDILINILLLFFLTIIQVTIIELIAINQIKPDLVLIALIYITLREGQIPGIIYSFFAGVILDILGNGIIGSNSFSKVIVMFVVGYFHDPFSITSFRIDLRFPLIVLISAIVDRILYIFITLSLDFNELINLMIGYGILPAIFTAITSLLTLIFTKRGAIST